SSGAAFGVVLAQILGLSSGIVAALGAAVFAFAGALLAATIVYLVATAPGGLAVQTLLLTGVIVGIFFSAAITVIISVVDFNRLTGVIHWLLGNLGPIPAASLALFAVLAGAGVWLILKSSRELNLLALGEEASRQLGVDAERLKRRVFVAAALLTGTVVAFTGPIGFVGLIVPHVGASGRSRFRGCRSPSSAARSSASSVPTARARRRCCGCSRACCARSAARSGSPDGPWAISRPGRWRARWRWCLRRRRGPFRSRSSSSC